MPRSEEHEVLDDNGERVAGSSEVGLGVREEGWPQVGRTHLPRIEGRVQRIEVLVGNRSPLLRNPRENIPVL